jgi:hypothetical protein
MALTATYEPGLSRIRLAADTLGATATYAVVDRTTNGVTYSTVRGGTALPVVAEAAAVDDYEFPVGIATTYRVRSFTAADALVATFTTTTTQQLDDVWLKSIPHPFLNQTAVIADMGDVARPTRGGVFDVVGRSFPVAVTTVRGSRRFDITVATVTRTEQQDLDLLLASGDAIFIHTPADYPLVGGYFDVADTSQTRQGVSWERRWTTLPLTEVAPPGPQIVGTTVNWQNVVNNFPTWADLIAGEATWNTVLERISDPADVVVP